MSMTSLSNLEEVASTKQKMGSFQFKFSRIVCR